MNFLTKFGQIALKFIQVAVGVAPIFQAAIPQSAGTTSKVIDELQQIAAIVQQAEIFGAALGLPGAQKLTGAAPSVAQMILQSSILAGRKIADPVKFQSGVTQVTAGMADILSALQDHGVEGAKLT